MEILHEPPSLDSFTPLTTHQSQTPSSFYEGPPVLHHHTHNTQLVISTHDLHSTPALSNLRASTSPPTHNGHTRADADVDNSQAPDIVLHGLDIYITSERFIIFSPTTAHGLAIPYPSFSLHAIQRLHLPSQQQQQHPPAPASEVQGLFMQISTSDGFDDHDLDATVSWTIVPAQQAPPPPPPPPAAAAAVLEEEQQETNATSPSLTTAAGTEIQALFAAVSSCSNLHPDAIDQDSQDGVDDDGAGGMYADADVDGDGYGEGYTNGGAGAQRGLPPPMPGSGGWITAENVEEFFDGEGNWRGAGGGRLGVGAGVVRGRQEGEGEGEDEGRGDGEGQGELEETKWRRTG